MSDFRRNIEAQLERAKIYKPSGRADLSLRLGYPDFEPATADKEEDKLSSKVCAPPLNSWNDPNEGVNLRSILVCS